MGYIYELFQAPRPEEEWTTEYDFDESPSAFPIAERVGLAANRDAVIADLPPSKKPSRLCRS